MKENSLVVAGSAIDAEQVEINQVLRGLGRHEAFQFMRSGVNAALARQYSMLKNADAYKLLGRKNWDEFCRIDLGMDRTTVDGYIKALDEFGERYFATAKQIRMPMDNYRLIEGQINEDGEIEIEGEKLAFTKQNAPRIRAFVEETRKKLGDVSEDLTRSKRAASEAKKKLSEVRARESKLFGDATPAQMLIYKAESDFMRAISQIEAAKVHDSFRDEDINFLHLMCQFFFAHTAAAGVVVCNGISHKAFSSSDQFAAEAMAEELDGNLASQIHRETGGKVKEFRKPQ